MRTVYLDNAATTRPDPRVLDAVRAFADEGYGNPASTHAEGRATALALERARAVVAARLGAPADELVFTSGGTEANNLALFGVAWEHEARGRHLVTSVLEHASVLAPCAWLERHGWSVTRVPVDGEGFVDPDDVARSLRPDTVLVSIGHANAEIGTLQPVDDLAAACGARGVLFHSDACQSFTKAPLGGDRPLPDLVSLNAHKLHGPKGVGALRVRTGVRLQPLLHGGEQEGALRAGTPNTPGIVGFGKAVELADPIDNERVAALRDALLERILAGIPGALLNGPRQRRLCTNLNVSFPGCSGRALLAEMDRRGVRVSRGSACSSGSTRPSHVLTAIGRTPDQADGSLRLTLSRFTDAADLDAAFEALQQSVIAVRRAS